MEGRVIVRQRRILSLAAVSILVLSMGLGVPAVLAGPPTEIGVTPDFQDLWAYCGNSATAYWTVSLGGGLSGNYSVTVTYGDGTYSTTPHPSTYDTHHVFYCGWGWVHQSWSASRSGGGTGHDYTDVETW